MKPLNLHINNITIFVIMYTLKYHNPVTNFTLKKEFKTIKVLSQYARRNDFIKYQVLNHNGEPMFLIGNELRSIERTILKLQELKERGGYYQSI